PGERGTSVPRFLHSSLCAPPHRVHSFLGAPQKRGVHTPRSPNEGTTTTPTARAVVRRSEWPRTRLPHPQAFFLSPIPSTMSPIAVASNAGSTRGWHRP